MTWLLSFVRERLDNPLYEHWVPGYSGEGLGEKKFVQVTGHTPQEKVSVANAVYATLVGTVWPGHFAKAKCRVRGCVKWDHLWLVPGSGPAASRGPIDWADIVDMYLKLDPTFPQVRGSKLEKHCYDNVVREIKGEAW
jgi:hypothetical protein